MSAKLEGANSSTWGRTRKNVSPVFGTLMFEERSVAMIRTRRWRTATPVTSELVYQERAVQREQDLPWKQSARYPARIIFDSDSSL
jgi:hypothetical protein